LPGHEGGHGDVYADDGGVDVNVDWMWSSGHGCVCGVDNNVDMDEYMEVDMDVDTDMKVDLDVDLDEVV
jgi:hypothetical protein